MGIPLGLLSVVRTSPGKPNCLAGVRGPNASCACKPISEHLCCSASCCSSFLRVHAPSGFVLRFHLQACSCRRSAETEVMPSILHCLTNRDTCLRPHLHIDGARWFFSMEGHCSMLRTHLIKLGMMSRPLMIRVAAATHHTQQRESCRGAGRRKRLGCSGGRKLKVPLTN